MRTILSLLIISVLLCNLVSAQAVGVGTTTPNSSAMLDVSSSNKGILVPRVNLVSLTDAATITSPATSLLVYNTNAAVSTGVGYYYNNGTPASPLWVKMLSSAGGWSLTGNAGTDAALHFIGTTDSRPLKFRVGNEPAGAIELSNYSTYFGLNSGAAALSNNIGNTAFGYETLRNYSGYHNTAVGVYALTNNGTFSRHNTALGAESMYSNTDGERNVAVGAMTLWSNTTGDRNIAIGDSSMYNNLTGNNNIAIGPNTLRNNLAASQNTAIGYYALEHSTDGTNTALGMYSMRDNTTGSHNTAVGHSSLHDNLVGDRNVAVGYQSLSSNTNGTYNTAIGYGSLSANEGGDNNTALGYLALNGSSTGTGDENVAVGSNALSSNEGNGNVAIGFGAMENNNNSCSNIAIGSNALANLTFTNTGILWAGDNIAIGNDAMLNTRPTSTTSGVRNIAIGNFVLQQNTTGSSNIALGFQSLFQNETGYWNNALGLQAMLNNTEGYQNVAIGNNSMRFNTTGYNNTVAGISALNENTTGFNNTAIGWAAGAFNNANTYCTFLGYDADQATGSNYNFSMALGYNSRITATSQIRIGDASATSIGGYEAWSNLSDGRFKRNISESVKGLDFIMALRPVTYNLDINAVSAYLKEDLYKDSTGKVVSKVVDPLLKKQRDIKSTVLHSGFIAQEVETAALSLGYDFSGVDKPKNDSDLYALRYSEFVVPLVKAVQEQQTEIAELKSKIEKFEKLVNELMQK